MTYRFKQNEMILTKVRDFTEFNHFSTCHNTHINLICGFCFLILTVKGSIILLNWSPSLKRVIYKSKTGTFTS